MKDLLIVFCLWLLRELTGHEYKPDGGDLPPVEPPNDLPIWLTQFGDLGKYLPRYSKKNLKAIYRVTSTKAAVFFAEPSQQYEVIRPDGTIALKHVFEAREGEFYEGAALNVPNGAHIAGYYKWIPTSTDVIAPAYSDGGMKIEICDPTAGVVRPDHVELVAYEVAPGDWLILA